ncbi:MAG: carbohydrate-binding family 9-like protein [Verrucomicrobiae bacterium]|nr:carbohydrate-binding family 9-like protein [Verrucomicrobiae bacterium]
MKIKAILIPFFCLIQGVNASERNRVEYPCYRLSQEPGLTADFDGAIWRAIPAKGGFLICESNQLAAKKPTFFKAGWTGINLCLAIKCYDGESRRLRARASEQGSVWLDDSVEIFFKPPKAKNYFQMVVNSAGTGYTGMGEAGSIGNPSWQAKSVVNNDGWSINVIIPFKMLGQTPANGERWPANVARNSFTGVPAETHTCWPPLKTGFHDTANFGEFVFKTEAPSALEAGKIAADLNAAYVIFLKEQFGRWTKEYPASLLTIKECLQAPALKSGAEALKACWDEYARLSTREGSTLDDQAIFLMRNTNLLRQTQEIKKQLALEKLFANVGK